MVFCNAIASCINKRLFAVFCFGSLSHANHYVDPSALVLSGYDSLVVDSLFGEKNHKESIDVIGVCRPDFALCNYRANPDALVVQNVVLDDCAGAVVCQQTSQECLIESFIDSEQELSSFIRQLQKEVV